MGDRLVKAQVALDAYGWTTIEPNPMVPGAKMAVHNLGWYGDIIEVSEAELHRVPGALVQPGQIQAGTTRVVAPTVVTDQELAEMDAGELVGHVGQNPGDARRVYDLETARRRPRVSVIRGIGFDPDTGEQLGLDETAGGVDVTGAVST